MVPQRGEGVVGTEQDHVTGFVDVEKFDVVRRVEKRYGISGRHGNVIAHGVVQPLCRTSGSLSEECQVTRAGSIREDTLGGVGRTVGTAEHGGGVEVALKRLGVPRKWLCTGLHKLIEREARRRRRSRPPRRTLRDIDARELHDANQRYTLKLQSRPLIGDTSSTRTFTTAKFRA